MREFLSERLELMDRLGNRNLFAARLYRFALEKLNEPDEFIDFGGDRIGYLSAKTTTTPDEKKSNKAKQVDDDDKDNDEDEDVNLLGELLIKTIKRKKDKIVHLSKLPNRRKITADSSKTLSAKKKRKSRMRL